MPSPEPPAKKSFYLPELDVLRAGAFLGVFVSHWIPHDDDFFIAHGVPRAVAHAVTTFAIAGGDGVMLFFCLSSYLITQLLLKELDARGRVDVRAFYMRRMLRIWPLYLTFTLIAGLMPFVDPGQHFGWKAIAAFVFFGGNWIWALGVPVTTIALPLWSISVEEQFYLCWPWVVRRATRRGLRNTVLGLFVLAAINRVLVVTGVLHVGLWNNTFTQLDPIGLGALLALGAGPRLEAFKERARGWLVAAALLGIYLVNLVHDDQVETSLTNLYFYPVVASCCAVALFATVGVKVDWTSPIARAVLYLGKISYGLYVFHYACFYVVNALYRQLPTKPNFVVAFLGRGALAMALTILLATLSYRYLEQPFLRLKAKFERTPAGREAAAKAIA